MRASSTPSPPETIGPARRIALLDLPALHADAGARVPLERKAAALLALLALDGARPRAELATLLPVRSGA